MDIMIEGRLPASFKITRRELKAAAEMFAARSSARVKAVWREVVVHLVDDRRSAEAHVAIMGIDGPTDAITQAYDAIPPEEPGLYGELFINFDQAVRAAPSRRTWSREKELLLYIAHGMDHLSGADDNSPGDYSRMRRRELSWLKSFCALMRWL